MNIELDKPLSMSKEDAKEIILSLYPKPARGDSKSTFHTVVRVAVEKLTEDSKRDKDERKDEKEV